VVDNSGSVQYSKVIMVEKLEEFASVPVVYPNPISQKEASLVTVELNPEIAPVGSDVLVSLIGPGGNVILKKVVVYSGESINLDLSGQNLSKGVSFLVVNSSSRRYQTKLLIQ